MMEAANLIWIEEPALAADLEGFRLLSTLMAPAVAGWVTFGAASQF